MVSFLCSLGLYFVSAKLYDVLLLTPYQKTVALTFLAFNYTLIYYATRTFRYQLIALLGTLTILLMLTHNWFAAGLSWGLLGLTCVYAGLRGMFAWVLFPNWVTLVTFLVIYSSWFFEKIKVYMEHEYYPSGIEGKIERVRDFTFKQLFSPFYFAWTYSTEGKTQLAIDFKNWFKKIGGVVGLYPPLTFLVPVALIVVIKGALTSPLWITLLVTCLLYPVIMRRFNARNSIIAIPLIAVLIGKGFPQVPEKWMFLGQMGMLAVFLSLQRATLLTKPRIKAKTTSMFLDTLPQNGVMVEGLISHFIAYGTKKRVVIIPHERGTDIEQMFLSIKVFNLHYAVISDVYKSVYKEGTYPALEYIETFYPLIQTIEEDENVYHVYEVQKDCESYQRKDKNTSKSGFYWTRPPRYN